MKAVDYKEIISKKDAEIAFLHKQLREVKALAEKNGSEIAKYKHEAVRLQEEVDKLNSVKKSGR